MWVLLSLGPPCVVARNSQDALPTLVTAKQAHSLTIDEASRHYPIRLKGVITYYDWLSDPVSALIFLHDQSGSIFATFPKLPHLRDRKSVV